MKLPPVEVLIRVPSGRLVVDNDLRYLWPEVDDNFEYSGDQWTKSIIDSYGDAGLFHGYVGNSCPGIYKDGDVLYIGNQPSAEKNRYLYEKIPGKHVASVCTDLWWYSICDYDDYIKRRGGPNDKWISIVKVEPGPYLLKHYWPFSDRADSYRNERMIYASIQRVYKLPNKWRLPEEGLQRDLEMLLNDIDYVNAEPNRDRTSFKVLVDLKTCKRSTIFKIEIPAEDISDRVKVAMAIRKKSFKEYSISAKSKRFWKNYRNKKLTPKQEARSLELIKEILAEIKTEGQ